MSSSAPEPVITMTNICTRFGRHAVHTGVNLDVRKSEIFALIGGSGSGKSTLLREMILLEQPDSGSIQILGQKLDDINERETIALRRRWGVVFQHGGLFGSLSVKENIGLPLREHSRLDDRLIDEIADWKLAMTGLAPEVGMQYPSELSGGMLKRASLARALALDPELLFLDEPTAGLDPESADSIDKLICQLRQQGGMTVVIITHDLDLLWQVADRVALLADGKILGSGSMQELAAMNNPHIRPFFNGARGRSAEDQAKRLKQTQTQTQTQTKMQSTNQTASINTGSASSKLK